MVSFINIQRDMKLSHCIPTGPTDAHGMTSLAILLRGAPTAACNCNGVVVTLSGKIFLCIEGQHQA